MPAKSKRLYHSTPATTEGVRAILKAAGFYAGKTEGERMTIWPEPNGCTAVILADGQRVIIGHDGENMLIGETEIDTLGETAALLGLDPLPIDPKLLPAPTPDELETAFDELDAYIAKHGPQAYFEITAYAKRVWLSKWRPEKRNEANRVALWDKSGRGQSYCVDSIDGKWFKADLGLPTERDAWLPTRGYVMHRLHGQEFAVPEGYKLGPAHEVGPRRSVVEMLASFAASGNRSI